MPKLYSPTRQVLTDDQAVAFARVLRALANPVRLRIVGMLAAQGQARQAELQGPLHLTQPTLSHHFHRLVEVGLVERVRVGRQVWFRLVPEAVDQVGDLLMGGPR